MISSTAFVFVILPCIAAVAVAAPVRDWRLAAAALCGALGLAFVLPTIAATLAAVAFPLAIGAALGSLAVLVGLLRRPTMGVWARMSAALLVAFVATFLNLITFAGGA